MATINIWNKLNKDEEITHQITLQESMQPKLWQFHVSHSLPGITRDSPLGTLSLQRCSNLIAQLYARIRAFFSKATTISIESSVDKTTHLFVTEPIVESPTTTKIDTLRKKLFDPNGALSLETAQTQPSLTLIGRNHYKLSFPASTTEQRA